MQFIKLVKLCCQHEKLNQLSCNSVTIFYFAFSRLAGQKTAADKRDGKKQPDEYFSQEFCEIDDETLFCM